MIDNIEMKRHLVAHIEKELSWSSRPWWFYNHISPLLQFIVDQYKDHDDYNIEFTTSQLIGFLYKRFDEEEKAVKHRTAAVQMYVEKAMEIAADTVKNLERITAVDAEHRLTNCIHGTTEQIMKEFS